MIIYPTIELQKGRCVSLHRGRLEEPQIWHVNPVDRARSFAAAGASWMHLTDFDAVAGNEETNADLVQEIIRAVGIPVQYGGGVKSMDQIAHWAEAGAGRIVISSAAVTQPQLVKDAAHAYPDQIVVAVDVYKGKVMSGGWRESTAFAPEDFIRQFDRDPLAAMIVTDIDADIAESDASLAMITRAAELASAPVIARGTIRSLDDISRLKYVPRVSGTIIGRSLFDRSVDLGEALAVAGAGKEATAPFV
ncbi:1-(5-phosphoribosyl)-5-[(5-phosphoribosylamino)methylideneamino] imidazole-4-carboxamide isomerase [Loktanella sp. IMCC34160]|uniref:1-(5-phosphoribosyl)-5-[(5- phosphoribosylamino)methylideneamino]imidazole-4- carboxamide isomerase n=1 Tax=Loktanella sp. IMCC34160 TaxID=2510646 RepID=UPI00101BE648|nr:1-(5-phosphoribosyl)-5-[(5-phosphoribosylamino)methylideneamino] imidazole-4-carboxamide isomerase [Loktanella sp. IMCC34160]RYG90693.1 1-(5-phosphoribosyl)-5-[(5-phosphoribosylamino)methylideneamino] imidazole-4-carboxamide isomerase [Loktanella sp. IMCC34160]